METISARIGVLNRLGTIRCMETMGERVLHLREQKELSQAGLADAIGVTQAAISQIESGTTKTLKGDVVAGMCRVLVTTPDFLLYGAGGITPEESVLIAELTRLAQLMAPAALESLLITARALERSSPKQANQKDAKTPQNGASLGPHELAGKRDSRWKLQPRAYPNRPLKSDSKTSVKGARKR